MLVPNRSHRVEVAPQSHHGAGQLHDQAEPSQAGDAAEHGAEASGGEGRGEELPGAADPRRSVGRELSARDRAADRPVDDSGGAEARKRGVEENRDLGIHACRPAE